MKLTQDEIFYINELANIAGIAARDCIIQGKKVIFLVKKENMGKAIGKKGSNIKELSRKIKKTVEIYAYSEDMNDFIQSNLPKLKVLEVKKEGKKIGIRIENITKTEMMLNKKRLDTLKMFLERMNGINEIRLLK